MNISPLGPKVAYVPWELVEGQGHFAREHLCPTPITTACIMMETSSLETSEASLEAGLLSKNCNRGTCHL